MTAESQYETAIKLVRERRKASVQLLQHEMDLPYGMACDFITKMEREGFITAPNAQGERKSLLKPIKKPKAKYTDAQLLSSG